MRLIGASSSLAPPRRPSEGHGGTPAGRVGLYSRHVASRAQFIHASILHAPFALAPLAAALAELRAAAARRPALPRLACWLCFSLARLALNTLMQSATLARATARRAADAALAAPRRAAARAAAALAPASASGGGGEAPRATPAAPGGPRARPPNCAGSSPSAPGAAAPLAAASIAAAAAVAWNRWGGGLLRARSGGASAEAEEQGPTLETTLLKAVVDAPTAAFLARLPEAMEAVDDAYYGESERPTLAREMRALAALADEFPLSQSLAPGAADRQRRPYAEAFDAARASLPAPRRDELELGARMLTFAEAAYESPSVIAETCRAEGFEVLYVEPVSQPGAPAHFLAFSPEAKTAVLAVRGTNTVGACG